MTAALHDLPRSRGDAEEIRGILGTAKAADFLLRSVFTARTNDSFFGSQSFAAPVYTLAEAMSDAEGSSTL